MKDNNTKDENKILNKMSEIYDEFLRKIEKEINEIKT